MPNSASPLPSPRRILSLDGGGIRGVYSLQILAEIEALFRLHRGRPELVLLDEFDLIAGTSTGAIIAAMLSWGMSVAQIEAHYLEEAKGMFTRADLLERWKTKYTAAKLTKFFQVLFSEDGNGAVPALLGTPRLRKTLLLVMRNASTGSAWPVTNNPKAKWNNRSLIDCNLNAPLWQLVRASTAAPTFFPPEKIKFGANEFLFLDGGITPYNNPALIAFLTATLPCYQLGWETGPEKLQVVSIGTGYSRTKLTQENAAQVNLLDAALHIIPALIQSISVEQDLLCRVLGQCVQGDPVESEIGDQKGHADGIFPGSEKKFSYLRYDHRFTAEEEAEMRATGSGDSLGLDNLLLIPILKRLGTSYAGKNVRLEHFFGSGTPAAAS